MSNRLSLALAGAVVALASLSAHAADFPEKPVKLVNPFPAGSPSDNAARLFAKKMQEEWGQPVIVENRAGAGGTIGTAYVAKALADGYTLVLGSSSTHIVAPVMRKALPYDADKDFTPIVIPGPYPQVIVVSAKLPVDTLQQLIEYGRTHPGELVYASSGMGSVLHLAGEMFASVTGVEMLHVPYKGANEAVNAVLSGDAQVIFDSPGSALPFVQSGKTKALAVMDAGRWFSFPDVPTTKELGMPQLRFSNWSGLYAPAGTPGATVRTIEETMRKVLAQPDVQETLRNMNAPVNPVYGEDMRRMMLDGQETLRKLVSENAIPLLD